MTVSETPSYAAVPLAPGEIVPVTAVALAARVPWPPAALPDGFVEHRRYAYGVRLRAPDGHDVTVFRFGAVVVEGAVGIPPRLADALRAWLTLPLLADTAETYRVGIDADRSDRQPRVGWDLVLLPDRRPQLIAAVMLLLGQSAALERYERAADELVDEGLELARGLASARAGLVGGNRELVARVGRLTRDRLELARWFFLVDRPEETWDDAEVARLYDDLFANLELRARHDAMLHKLGAVEEATRSALDLWQGRRSLALEWAIVWLIVVEIVFGFVGLM